MTQPLPLSPSVLTRKARGILNSVSPSSRKAPHTDGAVDVFVGSLSSPPPPHVLDDRRRTLMDELAAEGYAVEQLGAGIVRVRRPEDIERQRAELLAAGAAEAARLTPIVESLREPEPVEVIEAPLARHAYIPGKPNRQGQRWCAHCGREERFHEPDSDRFVSVDEQLALLREHGRPLSTDGALRAAPYRPEAADELAEDRAAAEGLVSGVAFAHPEQRQALIDAIAADRNRTYVTGWNAGHDAGVSEAGWVLLEARQKVDALKAKTFETGA